MWFFLIEFYLFLERREVKGKERERNIDVLPLTRMLTGAWMHNPGMCPDQESSQCPFALQNDIQPTKTGQGQT